ncbi:MAG: hypothetical protein Q8O10_06845 [candidate division Zixibacteria bacterium]|nr:hypothetical protein [candidate division Zixibacteria bacterium]
MKRKIILTLVLSLSLWRYGSAVELKSNITTYFNSYQTQDLYTEEKTSYLRAYQSFRFDLNQIGIKNLSVHTYFRSTTDFLNENSTDPSTKVYNAYIDWKNIKKILDLKLGRQFLYVGVGNGTMDGFRFDLKPKVKVQLTGYVGFQLPKNRWTDIDTWDKSHIFGGELATTYLRDTRLAVSYVKKERGTGPEQHLIGANATHQHCKLDFFSQFYYDLVYKKAQNFTLRGNGSSLWGKLYLSAEYQYRRPSIYSNSIFSVFKQDTYSILRFSGAYQPVKNFKFSSEYDLTLYKSGNSTRFRFGIEYAYIALGMYFRRGYGGESNGVYGKLIYTLNKNFAFSASADYGRYKIDEEQESKDDVFALASRVEWEPVRNLRLAVELQDVRNKIRSYDLRLQGKASYRFNIPFSGK